MKYIVSGSRRTGTSMMMAALWKGTTAVTEPLKPLDVLVAPDIEQANRPLDGYQPNPNGLWEVGPRAYLDAKFLRWFPEECLVKIPFDGLPSLYPSNYKIIFMVRNEAEIIASEDRIEKHFEDSTKAFLKENPKGKPRIDHNQFTELLTFCALRPYNKQDINHVLGICSVRTDIDLIQVSYNNVIANPIKEFTKLAEWGVPIVPEEAASTIDTNLYRVRNGKFADAKTA